MFSENTKTVFYAGWAIVVGLAAVAMGATSSTNWMVAAAVAVVPPLVVRRFWHAPEETISESIDHARR